MLTRENFQFARQIGATHVVAHLVDYFKGGAQNPRDSQPTGNERGWGLAGDPNVLWSLEELRALRQEVEAAGLKLEAIENFDPAHWHDVLLDGPKRRQQLENLKTIVRRLGQAGIPIMGYNFSLAGVAGRVTGPFARGGAESVGMDGAVDEPMPRGMVWNMVYDPDALPGPVLPVSRDDSGGGWRFPGGNRASGRGSRGEAGRSSDDPPMQLSAASRDSSTNRRTTSASSTCSPVRPMRWSSASAPCRNDGGRCLRRG